MENIAESSLPPKKRKSVRHECEARNAKNKKAMGTDDEQLALSITIQKAEGIDHPYLPPMVTDRIYNVVFWVEPGVEFCTSAIQGSPDPSWEHSEVISVRNPLGAAATCLNLVVQRYLSTNDPGTSTGRIVVGRARVPLPKELNRKKEGNFTLLRAQGEGFRPEGHIFLEMILEKINYER